MTWVRRDDQASIHRKVAPLDDATYRLWSEAMEWCSRNGTDGRIAAADLPEVSKRANRTRAGRLVERRLWHAAGTPCDSPTCPSSGEDGWVIHDYLEFNPSAAKVKAEKAAKKERQARWLEGKRGRRDASRDTSRDTSRDGSKDDAPSRPVPPRPEGRRGEDAPQHSPAAADAGAAAGEQEPSPRDSIICHTCGNTLGSSYHRRVCKVPA